MTSVIGRGVVAGAAGTTLLNAVTYLDVLVTGCEASSTPGQVVLRTAQAAGLDLPDDDSRLDAYGALGGMLAGVGVGVLASVARRLGVRVPAPVGASLIGLAAMAAADVPMAATGVSDPSTWSPADWARDLAPHPAYGVGVRLTLDAMTPLAGELPEPLPATASLVGRSLALGMAAGSRASFGLLGPALTGGSLPAVLVTGVLAAGELTGDKLPQTPSRLQAEGLASRITTAALGAAALAAQESRRPWLPAVGGVIGALAGSVAGSAWRAAAADRGLSWQGAVAEDVVALGLVAVAVRRT